MNMLVSKLQRSAAALGMAVALVSLAAPVQAQTAEQFIAIPSYRVGPYGTNGQSWYGGFVDYLTYVNLKEGASTASSSRGKSARPNTTTPKAWSATSA